MTNTCKACGRPIPMDQHICLQCGTENVMQTFEQRKKEPETNGDRIRAMIDDEELLSAIGTGCYRCAYSSGECDGYGDGCYAGNLKWLKQEAKEDAGSKTD